MRSLDVAYVPSMSVELAVRRRKALRPSEEQIARLECMFASGLDLWSGEPLQGEEARDWRHLQNPRPGRPSRMLRRDIA